MMGKKIGGALTIEKQMDRIAKLKAENADLKQRLVFWEKESRTIVDKLAEVLGIPSDPCPGWEPCVKMVAELREAASNYIEDVHNCTDIDDWHPIVMPGVKQSEATLRALLSEK